MNYIEVPRPTVTAIPPMAPSWQDSYDNAIMSPKAYKKYNIVPSTAEYQTIAKMVHPLQIDEVERVVNPDLWKRFVNTRKEMLRSKSVNLQLLRKLDLDEREVMRCVQLAQNFNSDELMPYSDNMVLLFHCTKSNSNLQNILSQGLDERLSNFNIGVLGKGIYFADDARKSVQYDGTGYILVFAVLLGDCISVDEHRHKSNLVREPEKVTEQKRNLNDLFFDSIVARPNGYNEYVIYNRYQCCPLYQVHYQRDSPLLANRSIYNYAAQNLPPIAWIRQNDKYAMPIRKVYKQWPFYAVDVFTQMEAKQLPQTTASTTENATKNETIPSMMTNTQSSTIDVKLATLVNLGFTDTAKNVQILFKFNYDLDQAVNYFLDDSNVPNAFTHLNRPIPIKPNFSQNPPVEVCHARPMPSTSSKLPSVPPAFDMPSSSTQCIPSTSGSAFAVVKEDNSTMTVASTSDDDDYSEDEFQYSDDDMDEVESREPCSIKTVTEIPNASSKIVEVKPPTTEECLICCCEYAAASPGSWEVLKCSHKVCSTCYGNIRTNRTTMAGVEHTFVKCPFCQGTTGVEVGICPDIRMDVTVISKSCESYEPLDTICIHYHYPSGHLYLNRYAFLPNNAEGQEILKLLKVAWDRRLCFTIGTSVTTGRENAIVWNIHHKTSVRGGVSSYGYPDPGYFERVRWELKNYGIE